MNLKPTRPVSGGTEIFLPSPRKEDWIAEPKYNGWRVLITDRGTIYNRHGGIHDYVENIPWLAEKEVVCQGLTLDCELVGHRNTKHPNALIIFDILNDPRDGRLRRAELLEKGFKTHNITDMLKEGEVYLSPQHKFEKAQLMFDMFEILEYHDLYEGVVIKDVTRSYPTNRWIKFRFDQYIKNVK